MFVLWQGICSIILTMNITDLFVIVTSLFSLVFKIPEQCATLLNLLFVCIHTATNPCASSNCSNLCLLSSSDTRGYNCYCSEGSYLSTDGITCISTGKYDSFRVTFKYM